MAYFTALFFWPCGCLVHGSPNLQENIGVYPPLLTMSIGSLFLVFIRCHKQMQDCLASISLTGFYLGFSWFLSNRIFINNQPLKGVFPLRLG